MRIRFQLGYVLGASAALSMLAACAGAGTGTNPSSPGAGGATVPEAVGRQLTSGTKNVLPPSMQARVHTGTKPSAVIHPTDKVPEFGPVAAISDFNTNEVYVVDTSGTIIFTLIPSTGLNMPQGMSLTNRPRKLYVANSGANDILVFSSANAPVTLSNGGVEPSDVAVDNAGNVAAMNISAGTVNCLDGGATSPTSTISGGGFTEVTFGAFDKAGNLYVDGFNANGNTQVGEIVGGCASGTTISALTTTNTLIYPGGVQIAKNGNIEIDDQLAVAVYGYTPPTGGSLGSPATTTPMNGAGDPVTIALTPGPRGLTEADAALANGALYAFPGGGSPKGTAPLPGASLPVGIAVHLSEQF